MEDILGLVEDAAQSAPIRAPARTCAQSRLDDLQVLNQKTKRIATGLLDPSDLETLNQLLDQERRLLQVQSRSEDLVFIQQISGKIQLILDKLTDELLAKARPKDLAISLGILLDKRDQLLGWFDDTRQRKKQGLRLRVMFQGEGGTGGVEIETEE